MASFALALILWLSPRSFAQEPAQAPPQAGSLQDVLIKGAEKDEPTAAKPAFDLSVDPYETLRPSLKHDPALLLLESPALATWSASRPERLRDVHLIQPWSDGLQELPSLALSPRDAVAASSDAGAKAQVSSWTLSLIDEDGKPFKSFAGKGPVPRTLAWDGKSDRGDWMLAGHAYSALYKLAEAGGTSRTVTGRTIQLDGLVRREGETAVIGLDSAALFGGDRSGADVADQGKRLLRAAADWIKRRAYGRPVQVRVFGSDAGIAAAQAAAVKAALAGELAVPAERIAAAGAPAAASEQRVDLSVDGR